MFLEQISLLRTNSCLSEANFSLDSISRKNLLNRPSVLGGIVLLGHHILWTEMLVSSLMSSFILVPAQVSQNAFILHRFDVLHSTCSAFWKGKWSRTQYAKQEQRSQPFAWDVRYPMLFLITFPVNSSITVCILTPGTHRTVFLACLQQCCTWFRTCKIYE